MDDTYWVRSAGGLVWHIPGHSGTPLCAGVLQRPERRYTPAGPHDLVCEKWWILYSLPKDSRLWVLETLSKYADVAGPPERIDVQPDAAGEGQNVVTYFDDGAVVANVFIPKQSHD
jgi:hypothetical protein